jgi:hypothetical protein
MARTTSQAARKHPRTDDGPSEAVVPTDDGEEGEEGDGLDEADYHTLLVATLRELRELKLVAPRRHELQRVENTGVCGMPECKEPGCRLACITCKVRLCRNTWCWNQHINDNRGDVVGSKRWSSASARTRARRRSALGVPGSRLTHERGRDGRARPQTERAESG